MSTITTRSGKGSPLTNSEVDSNFTNLNTDKLEDITGESIKDLSDVNSSMSPTNGQVLTWDNANSRWSSADSTGGVSEISEDTTPQLGGDLDANGNDIKLDSNEKIYFGDSTDPDVHYITYDTASDVLRFKSNAQSGWAFSPWSGGHSFTLDRISGAGGWDINIRGNSTAGTITTNYDNYTNPVYFQKNGTTKISFLNSGAVRLANLDINGAYTLPTSDGTSGQVLTTDGSGSVTFQTASGGGGNTTNVGWENNATISQNYTITTNNNMVSAGPVTVDTGYSVTVPSGSRWVIV
jgi:hypothetical protein